MKEQDIVSFIKKDHMPLKEGIRILKSDSVTDSQKKKALKSFLRDLELHAKAEERSLYDNAQTEGDVRSYMLEGYEEHEIADTLALELKALDFEKNWSDKMAAKAKVLAELVEHHVQEEEEEMLPDVQECFSKDELVQLGQLYVQEYRSLEEQLMDANIHAGKYSSEEASMNH